MHILVFWSVLNDVMFFYHLFSPLFWLVAISFTPIGYPILIYFHNVADVFILVYYFSWTLSTWEKLLKLLCLINRRYVAIFYGTFSLKYMMNFPFGSSGCTHL